ncbi:hypothetical protein SAMN05216505_104288 [Streptomyces prasinopilosus]|uniref:Uncharacterized protein n=1 Tax=Streptomyces prasinopilosus TaxID=67344 RepID=A0A1G6QWZ0_9ACTN|nr:hypothetical protein SAMN05216505_104288 [Streptomyces prasinopilosus]
MRAPVTRGARLPDERLVGCIARRVLRPGARRPLTGVRRPSCCRTRPRSVSWVVCVGGVVPLGMSGVLSEVRAGYPGGSLNGAWRFDPGRREAAQALLVERPASRDTWPSMGWRMTVRHLCPARPRRKRHADPAGPGPADGPSPADDSGPANGPGPANGSGPADGSGPGTRPTAGAAGPSAVPADVRHEARGRPSPDSARPGAGGVGRPSSPVRKPWRKPCPGGSRTCVPGTGSRRGTPRRSPARRPSGGRCGPPRSPSASTAARTAPRGTLTPSPWGRGKRSACRPQAFRPRPRCAPTEHRGKWRPGRECSTSRRWGRGPAPPCPSAPAAPRLLSGTSSLRTAAGASRPRRGRGGEQGLPAAASGRGCRAPAGRGGAEAPVRRAGAVTTDRGGGVPRRSERTTTAATDPYSTSRKQDLS